MGDLEAGTFPSGSGSRRWPRDPSCGGCGELVDQQEHGAKLLGATAWHRDCYNAKHCLTRMASADSALKEHLQTVKDKDPEKYRGILMSLKASPGQRSSSQRAKTKTFIVELCSEVMVRRKKSVLMLPRRQFVAWYVHNELLTPAQAEQKWEEDKVNPDIKHEVEDGVMCIAVRMPTEVAGIDQVVKRKKISNEAPVESAEDNNLATASLRHGAGSIHDVTFAKVSGNSLSVGASSSNKDFEGSASRGRRPPADDFDLFLGFGRGPEPRSPLGPAPVSPNFIDASEMDHEPLLDRSRSPRPPTASPASTIRKGRERDIDHSPARSSDSMARSTGCFRLGPHVMGYRLGIERRPPPPKPQMRRTIASLGPHRRHLTEGTCLCHFGGNTERVGRALSTIVESIQTAL